MRELHLFPPTTGSFLSVRRLPLPWRRGAGRSRLEGSPGTEERDRRVEVVHDLAARRLDAAFDEEVHTVALAACAAQIREQPDRAALLRVGLHERVEDADLAGGAVVDHRPVEDREDRVRGLEPLPVLREDLLRARRQLRELVLVWD